MFRIVVEFNTTIPKGGSDLDYSSTTYRLSRYYYILYYAKSETANTYSIVSIRRIMIDYRDMVDIARTISVFYFIFYILIFLNFN